MSFLSNAVVHLFHIVSDNKGNGFLQETTEHQKKDLSLFVKSNCLCLMQIELNNPDDFIAALTNLKPVLKAIKSFDFASCETHKKMKQQRPDILNVLNSWCDMFVTKNSMQIVVVLLQITSHLERTFGNVFHLKGKVCPFLLRDLLTSPELSEICLPWRMKMFQLLLGGPFSLNLRNLVWHGFVAPGEIPIECSKMMFACVYDLYCYLEETSIFDHFQPRPFFQINIITNILKKSLPVETVEENIDNIKALFETSPYIAESMLPYFIYSISCYKNQQFDLCVVVLLPQLEALLRCQFASCNNMPERVMTAQSTEFYTTMDEVLLIDIFNQPEGLRLRDRLSHGELDPSDVTQYIADVILFIVTYASHRPLKSVDDESKHFDACPKSCVCSGSAWLTNIRLQLSKYESVFHPLAVARRLANECFNLSGQVEVLAETVRLEQAGDLASDNEICGTVYKDCARLFNSWFCREPNTSGSGDLKARIEAVRQKRLETLDRSDGKTLEASVFLRQIAKNSLNAAQSLFSTMRCRSEDFRAKKLRSRQRRNFQRLIQCCPVITAVLKFHCCAVFIFIHHRFDADTLAALRRNFKTLLKISEKLVTFTSADVNKWDEAAALASQLCQLFRQL